MKNILIVGSAGSGKSTFANMLAKRLGCGVGETGDQLALAVARTLECFAAPEPIKEYDPHRWSAKLKENKKELRGDLASYGNLLTALDPGCLVRMCVSRRIVVGLRRRSEYLAYMAEFPQRLDCVVLIIRPFVEVAHNRFDIEFFNGVARHLVRNELDEVHLQGIADKMAEELKE